MMLSHHLHHLSFSLLRICVCLVLQEIIDALATPGARGLLALLNEPLFDEVLIRRTKYGMDCLLLLLQFLPFDVEERDAAQV